VAKLLFKGRVVLDEMKYATNIFSISLGLMFASKKRIDRGMCLVMPLRRDGRFSGSVTMLFVFRSMDILFVNSDFEVVDKKMLRPFVFSYTPKKACRFVIESSKGKFDRIKVGDRLVLIQ
jgi:uncharacterized protein